MIGGTTINEKGSTFQAESDCAHPGAAKHHAENVMYKMLVDPLEDGDKEKQTRWRTALRTSPRRRSR